MSMSADMLMFDWDTIVSQIVDHGCPNRNVVEEVLQMYGEKICDNYVIMSDDHRDIDELHMVCNAIESLFDIEDCFGVVYALDFRYIGGWSSDNSYEKDRALRKLAELIGGDKHEK